MILIMITLFYKFILPLQNKVFLQIKRELERIKKVIIKK